MFFNYTAITDIYTYGHTLSLHDALPIVPLFVVLALARGEALLDRVLMAAREGGIDQLAAIGVARVDRELVAIFDRGDDLVDVREVELWVDALRVHVERDGDEAGVAGALAVDRKSTRLNSSH